MTNKDFVQFADGMPVGWQKAYNNKPEKVVAAQVPSFVGTDTAVRITSTEANCGIIQEIGEDLAALDNVVLAKADCSVLSGRVAVEIVKADHSSVFFSDAFEVTQSGRNITHIGGNEYIAIQPVAGEVASPTASYSLSLLRSLDGCATWVMESIIKTTTGVAMYPQGPYYDQATGRGTIFYATRTSANFDTEMWMLEFDNNDKMTTVTDDVFLRSKNTYFQGHVVRHSSGLFIYPVMTAPAGIDWFSYDFVSGMVVSDDHFATVTFLTGSPAGWPRGLVETSCVELSNGNVLFVGNTTSGYLMKQLWVWNSTTATFTPQSVASTGIQSTRCKHDIRNLSDGTIALVWSAATKDASNANLPRTNFVLAFSDDDFVTLQDPHTIYQTHDPRTTTGDLVVYESYIVEIAGTLRVDYQVWDVADENLFWAKTAELSVLRRHRELSRSAISDTGILSRSAPKSIVTDSALLKISAFVNAGTFDVDNVSISELGLFYTDINKMYYGGRAEITGLRNSGVLITGITGAVLVSVAYPDESTWVAMLSGLVEGDNTVTLFADDSGTQSYDRFSFSYSGVAKSLVPVIYRTRILTATGYQPVKINQFTADGYVRRNLSIGV